MDEYRANGASAVSVFSPEQGYGAQQVIEGATSGLIQKDGLRVRPAPAQERDGVGLGGRDPSDYGAPQVVILQQNWLTFPTSAIQHCHAP